MADSLHLGDQRSEIALWHFQDDGGARELAEVCVPTWATVLATSPPSFIATSASFAIAKATPPRWTVRSTFPVDSIFCDVAFAWLLVDAPCDVFSFWPADTERLVPFGAALLGDSARPPVEGPNVDAVVRRGVRRGLAASSRKRGSAIAPTATRQAVAISIERRRPRSTRNVGTRLSGFGVSTAASARIRVTCVV